MSKKGYSKHLFDKLLEQTIEEEKKGYRDTYEPWERHEAKLRASFEQASEQFYNRITHALKLIEEHFRT